LTRDGSAFEGKDVHCGIAIGFLHWIGCGWLGRDGPSESSWLGCCRYLAADRERKRYLGRRRRHEEPTRRKGMCKTGPESSARPACGNEGWQRKQVSQGENAATRRVSATLAAWAWGTSTPASPKTRRIGEERRIHVGKHGWAININRQPTLGPPPSARSLRQQGPGQRLLHARKYLVDRPLQAIYPLTRVTSDASRVPSII
jgi:hypothetical protein